MNGKIANKLWAHTAMKLADELEIACPATVHSNDAGSAATAIWNRVRANIKPAKDILEEELYDTNPGR